MHPRISINGLSSRTWTLEQDLAFYRSAGVTVITGAFGKLGANWQTGVDAIKAAGIQTPLLTTGAALNFLAGLDKLKPAIDAAAALKCPLYSVSGGAPARMSTDDAYNMLLKALEPISAYARTKGVQLVIENNSVATRGHGFIHTTADTADLARDADLGICLELQNCWYERRLPELFKANMKRMTMVQVSDFVVGEELRLNRRVPGDGSIPLEWLIARLLEAGYTGYFDIEVLGPAIEAEGYSKSIARSVEWLSECLVRLGV